MFAVLLIDCLFHSQSSSPAYHLLHGQLEWRLLRLSIRYEMFKLQSCDSNLLEDEFLKIVQDLVMLSVAKYSRVCFMVVCFQNDMQGFL